MAKETTKPSLEDVALCREMYLREYETLRRESLDSMSHRTQIVALGLATVGALAGGTFALMGQKDQREAVIQLVALVSFGFVIPAVCVLVLYLWYGEIERMMRAGEYLKAQERLINLTLPRRIFNWEQWIRTKKQLKFNNYMVLAFYLMIVATSSMVPLLFIGSQTGTLLWASGNDANGWTDTLKFLFFIGASPRGLSSIARFDVWCWWLVAAVVAGHLYRLGRTIESRYRWGAKLEEELRQKEEIHKRFFHLPDYLEDK
jgi:hypothetical protein